MEITVTLPNDFAEHLKKKGVIDHRGIDTENKTDEEVMREFIEQLLPAMYGTSKKKPEWEIKHPKRFNWFLKAYYEVQEHPARKEDDLLYCFYLEDHCRTLKELKQKMYESFPFLKSNT